MFDGFVTLEGTLVARVLVRNSSNTPVAPDAAPTYRIYGPSGLMASGTGTTTVGDVTGLYSVSIAALAANGYEAGESYAVVFSGLISSVGWGELHVFCVG